MSARETGWVFDTNAIKYDTGPAHDGVGDIFFKRLLTGAELAGPWDHIDVAVIPPGRTIGVHTHGANEELYFVAEGEATMHLDGKDFPVKPGHLIVNRVGGTHGLRNDTDKDVKIFVVQVRAPAGAAAAAK